ncbi:Protein CBG25213 [Caenorhabditis briggsae]|uniref:Protein CBG25213 n=1 Tax=Caenorhabditis briggsae TaxID=6238 RepID=B6IJH1_CAEBR|nr:Protein CBG25213 [Caenorhabditis briggsae]CAS00051.1 Protein CBG25213 [Caenorhabditis briggsae]
MTKYFFHLFHLKCFSFFLEQQVFFLHIPWPLNINS